jgi:ribosome-interacting GTPase 1
MLIKAFKEEVDEEIDVLFVSSVTNKNLDVLKDKLWHLIN